MTIKRNQLCQCGSGKRYKMCCATINLVSHFSLEEVACPLVDRGNKLLSEKKYPEALKLYQEALSVFPEYARAHYNIGVLHGKLGQMEAAASSYEKSLDIEPEDFDALNNLGVSLRKLGQLEEAFSCYSRALAITPGDAVLHNNLGLFFHKKGFFEEACTHFRQALSLKPDYFEAHSNLLFCFNQISSHNYLDEVRLYGRQASDTVSARFFEWNCSVKPDRLRVGLVSGDLGEHPVGFFLENMLASIDPTKIELVAYPTHNRDDALTTRIRPHFVAWNPLHGKSDESAARMIHDDGVHVLLDLSGHTRYNRLPVFSWKPAPVQATWLGYLASTGLTEMDYIIADSVVVAESQEKQFTERVLRLPEGMFCFSPPFTGEELPTTPLPGQKNGYVTFGCFQNLAKINDEVLIAWGRIFQALPEARLRLQNDMLYSKEIRDQLQRRLVLCGINPERVVLEKSVSRKDYLVAHELIDISLDTFPYTGCTTICGALWMGVPTVTLAGDTMIARQGASLLTFAGLTEWVAVDEEDYVAKAVTYSRDLEKLARLRSQLRQQVLASPVFNGQRFSKNFEAAMWGMWRSVKAE